VRRAANVRSEPGSNSPIQIGKLDLAAELPRPQILLTQETNISRLHMMFSCQRPNAASGYLTYDDFSYQVFVGEGCRL
ncbi:MAG: hypothetical protein AAFN74_09625, partial [Myxococcota bacterium]